MIYKALKEFLDSIGDDPVVVNDHDDEVKEVVGKEAIGWFECIEEEMGDLHAKAGLLRGGGPVQCGKGCCCGVGVGVGASAGRVTERLRLARLRKSLEVGI